MTLPTTSSKSCLTCLAVAAALLFASTAVASSDPAYNSRIDSLNREFGLTIEALRDKAIEEQPPI